MLLFNVIVHLLVLYLVPSKSQERNSEALQKPVNDEQNLKILDYETPGSDLWLISRDDPIPFQLNRRWPLDNGRSRFQIVNPESFRQDIVTQTNRDNSGNFPVSSQLPYSGLSQYPVANYGRILTSEDRGRNSERSDVISIQNPRAVLIQLPADVTDDLWVKPNSQTLLQLPLNGVQNILTENQNFQNDEITDVKRDLQTEHLPIQETDIRLPHPEVEPQAELNVPVGRFYQAPFHTPDYIAHNPSSRPYDGNIQNTNFGTESPIPSQQENSRLPQIQPPRHGDIESHGNSAGIPHTYGNALTSDDIELLERLGILSSLVLESNNITSGNDSTETFHREYNIHPILIDNDSQMHVSPEENRRANSSEIILIDVPRFTPAAYNSEIPENVGIHNNAHRLVPYTFLQSQNATRLNESNDNFDPQFSYKLIDTQLVEFLNLLGLNTEDFINQSSEISFREDGNVSVENRSGTNKSSVETVLKSYSPSGSSNDKLTLNNNTNEHSLPSAATTSKPSELSNKSNNRTIKDAFVQPSVTNGRIQPRVLEKPFAKESKLIQLLAAKVVPVSERKPELLNKLEILPQPYVFGFKQNDGNGTSQHRNETSDANGVVKGSYGYKDNDGVYRIVNYIADDSGFHAVVKTNEPGTISHNTADAVFMAETPPLAALLKMMDYTKLKLSNITDKS